MKRFTSYVQLILFLILVSPCLAKTLKVGPSESIQKISVALSQASHGDTIIIKGGTYREGNLIISKSVLLIGESYPILDGQNKFEVLSINADHVTISGFKIVNSGISSMHDLAGIGADEANHLHISNNIFDNNFFGIHIANSNNVLIKNNKLIAYSRPEHQTGNGIHLWQCSNAIIDQNMVINHRDGIYFEFVTNSQITNNYSERNLRYGLHFMFSHHDTYKGNTFKNNGAGVAVMYTNNVEMYDNIFEDNWGDSAYGLLLKDINDSFIEGNIFRNNTTGILMEGSNRGNIEKNVFETNGWAVKLQANCDGNSFRKNNFLSNTFDVVTNGTMVLNAFQYNYWDRYQGYDLNRDGIGDVPFRPVSMYAMVIDRMPTAVMLWRSFLVFLLDKAERVVPVITPENLKDDYPMIKAYDFN